MVTELPGSTDSWSGPILIHSAYRSADSRAGFAHSSISRRMPYSGGSMFGDSGRLRSIVLGSKLLMCAWPNHAVLPPNMSAVTSHESEIVNAYPASSLVNFFAPVPTLWTDRAAGTTGGIRPSTSQFPGAGDAVGAVAPTAAT